MTKPPTPTDATNGAMPEQMIDESFFGRPGPLSLLMVLMLRRNAQHTAGWPDFWTYAGPDDPGYERYKRALRLLFDHDPPEWAMAAKGGLIFGMRGHVAYARETGLLGDAPMDRLIDPGITSAHLEKDGYPAEGWYHLPHCDCKFCTEGMGAWLDSPLSERDVSPAARHD